MNDVWKFEESTLCMKRLRTKLGKLEGLTKPERVALIEWLDDARRKAAWRVQARRLQEFKQAHTEHGEDDYGSYTKWFKQCSDKQCVCHTDTPRANETWRCTPY